MIPQNQPYVCAPRPNGLCVVCGSEFDPVLVRDLLGEGCLPRRDPARVAIGASAGGPANIDCRPRPSTIPSSIKSAPAKNACSSAAVSTFPVVGLIWEIMSSRMSNRRGPWRRAVGVKTRSSRAGAVRIVGASDLVADPVLRTRPSHGMDRQAAAAVSQCDERFVRAEKVLQTPVAFSLCVYILPF